MNETMMTYKQDIYSHFNFELTNDQKLAIKKLQNFINNNSKIFILQGSAGTGKTTIMEGIIDYLHDTQNQVSLLAPTGRAAKILQEKTNRQAFTIHRTIYTLHHIKECRFNNNFYPKYIYSLRNNTENDNIIYIIDEASMISNIRNKSKHHQFGSGNVLKDLIKFCNVNSQSNNSKIIFLGDPTQLPPIYMENSPALNEYYFNNLSSNFNVESCNLKEIKRQNPNSKLMQKTIEISNGIHLNDYNQLEVKENQTDIKNIDITDLPTIFNNEFNQKIIIAYSNKKVNEYNKFVRDHIFGRNTKISNGDRIVVTQNSYFYERNILNGELGYIHNVNENIETFNVKLNNNEIVKLIFRNVLIKFDNQEIIKCKIIENNLNNDKPDLSDIEEKALYLLFKTKNKNITPSEKGFYSLFNSDPYINALRVKFGYAITCHKAQGGEWKDVIIDFETSNYIKKSVYYKWAYTGISRAKENLFCINSNYFNETIKKQIRSHNFDFNKYMEKDVNHIVEQHFDKRNIKVAKIMEFPFMDRIEFYNDNEEATFDFFYNDKWEILNIKPLEYRRNRLENMLSVQLKQLMGKHRIISNSNSFFPDDKLFLETFYNRINNLLEDTTFYIAYIKHLRQIEQYVICNKNGENVINFHYDDIGIFYKYKMIFCYNNNLIKLLNIL